MSLTKYTTTDPKECVDIRLNTSTSAGAAAFPPRTVIDIFQSTMDRFPNKGALFFKKKINVSL